MSVLLVTCLAHLDVQPNIRRSRDIADDSEVVSMAAKSIVLDFMVRYFNLEMWIYRCVCTDLMLG